MNARLLVVAVAAGLLAGCGLPPAGTSATIPPDQLPYGLEQTAPRATATSPLPVLTQGPAVWMVRRDKLAAIPAPARATDSTDPKVIADALIARLAYGPNDTDIGNGFRSALGPTMTLKLRSVEEGVARVELNPGDSGQGGAAQLPLATGQVVLTLTSVPGIDSVQVMNRDEPLSVPLPSGILTTRALTAQDYLALVESPAALSRGTQPTPGQAPTAG